MTQENNARQVALVTGGSGGIGRAVCVELARFGCYVIVNYMKNRQGAETTLAQLQTAGGDGEIVQFDVRDREAAERAVEDIANRHGRIDVLVNNAGTLADGLFMMMSPENWHSVIDTSLHGFYNMTRPVLEHMVRARRGCVVSISSAASLMPNRGQANYAASKAGVIGLTRTLALEGGFKNVTANCIAPGFIETDMVKSIPEETLKGFVKEIPLGRIGLPSDIAAVAAFLGSDDAAYVTGQTLIVSGGSRIV